MQFNSSTISVSICEQKLFPGHFTWVGINFATNGNSPLQTMNHNQQIISSIRNEFVTFKFNRWQRRPHKLELLRTVRLTRKAKINLIKYKQPLEVLLKLVSPSWSSEVVHVIVPCCRSGHCWLKPRCASQKQRFQGKGALTRRHTHTHISSSSIAVALQRQAVYVRS